MRVMERVIKVARAGLLLRVWCTAQDLRSREEYEEHRAAIANAVAAVPATGEHPAVDVAEAVAALPFCSAVEVSDGPVRPGLLIYPEWP